MILQAQTKWRWIIAVYLFLAGLGAGAYLTGVVAEYLGPDWMSVSRIGVALGFPCVFLGSMFLIFDLGTPANFWRAFRKPNSSWMARGTIIITIFMVLSAIHTAFWLWPFRSLEGAEGARHFIGVVGGILALCTMIYTGILLAAARPIAFWSTPMLPLLFLVSALSTGIMAIVLIASLGGGGHGGAIGALAKVDVVLIILEILVLVFYLQGSHRVPESRASAMLVLSGSVAPLFWIGVAVIGLLIPLVLELAGAVAVLASICGVIGGLCLRQVVLSAGIHAPLRAGRFEITFPT